MWTALINDTINAKTDATPYVYVLVNKALPQNLTLWNNGTAQYAGIPVNTGAPGADTVDGTYAVFEHVRFSEMKGTNPDGSTYDDPNVPYASYFNGGDALHGFIRSSYGSPQSNGCVEMTYANAALVWPLTPIGTLVTVIGPDYGTAPPATTTTTTAAPPPTTTTAPPATTTTAPPATTVVRGRNRRFRRVAFLAGRFGPERRCGPRLRRRSLTSYAWGSAWRTRSKYSRARGMSPARSYRSASTYHWRRCRSAGLRSILEAPAVASMEMAPLRSPVSASDDAATMRPSASTSGSGELCRSSVHSSATFFGLRERALAVHQLGEVRRPSRSELPNAVRWRAASRQRPLR